MCLQGCAASKCGLNGTAKNRVAMLRHMTRLPQGVKRLVSDVQNIDPHPLSGVHR